MTWRPSGLSAEEWRSPTWFSSAWKRILLAEAKIGVAQR